MHEMIDSLAAASGVKARCELLLVAIALEAMWRIPQRDTRAQGACPIVRAFAVRQAARQRLPWNLDGYTTGHIFSFPRRKNYFWRALVF
jgi:hypothetical protein